MGLTASVQCSTFVLMEVETLGGAWKVHMRCANGYRLETRSMRKCAYRKQLDLETLVATPRAYLSTREAGRAFDVSCVRESKGRGGL
jgi:hypothetical protein